MKEHYLAYIQNSIKNGWDRQALTNYKKDSYSYAQMAEAIAKYHILFEKAGLKKGEKAALCGPNSARWGVAFLAITSFRAVAVPILNDFLPESVMTLTDHSEAHILFVSKEVWRKLDPAKMPLLIAVFSLEDGSLFFSKSDALNMAHKSWNALFKEKYPSGFKPEHVNYPTD